MSETEDIPTISDRQQRFDEILVDCYGQAEELAAMEVYLMDAMEFPCAAIWRDPDEPGHHEVVTVTGVVDTDERRGVLLGLQRTGGKTRRAPAEQVWANDAQPANGVVLEDYRYWVNELNGLTPGFE